jgi:hypothetical protein
MVDVKREKRTRLKSERVGTARLKRIASRTRNGRRLGSLSMVRMGVLERRFKEGTCYCTVIEISPAGNQSST